MATFRRFQTWIRGLDPFRVDVATAALLLAAWVVEVVLINDADGDRLVTLLFGAAGIVPVAWRRRNPLVPPLAFAVVILAQTPFDSYVVSDGTMPFVTLLLVLYSLGRHVEGRPMWLAGGAAIVATMISLTFESWPSPEDVLWASFILGAPLLAGGAIRNRTQLNRELRAKAARAEAERGQRAREAIEAERSRIAAELQAVVANGVSAMVVQAETVPRLVGAGDGGRAREALIVIEETGRDALSEMRRLLGVLRRDDDGADLAPQPSLRRAGDLVARFDGEGLRVALEVEGDESNRELSPGVDLAAYRVLEHGLESARDAGATSADVSVRYGDRDLELAIADDRPAGAAGDEGGRVALRDRLAIYGGHLAADDGDGASVLRARLPRRVA